MLEVLSSVAMFSSELLCEWMILFVKVNKWPSCFRSCSVMTRHYDRRWKLLGRHGNHQDTCGSTSKRRRESVSFVVSIDTILLFCTPQTPSAFLGCWRAKGVSFDCFIAIHFWSFLEIMVSMVQCPWFLWYEKERNCSDCSHRIPLFRLKPIY